MENVKVYDCFCYFNEDMLLKLRLETLWNYVDVFVISEASYTHKGDQRQLLFDINKFDKYAEKIRYCPTDQRPKGENDFWKNENHIRNNVVNGLWDCNGNDQILISDLDEIPNPDAIKLYNPNYLRGDFVQTYYAYFLNNKWVSNKKTSMAFRKKSTNWLGSKITMYDHFKKFFKLNASSVRIYKSSGILRSIKREWFRQFSVQLLKNGGWHFTWALSLSEIKLKMQSTAHVFDEEKFLLDKNLIEEIMNGRDFTDPNKILEAQTLDSSFPKYLVENQGQFKEFLLNMPAVR